jgi:hypothetical protein
MTNTVADTIKELYNFAVNNSSAEAYESEPDTLAFYKMCDELMYWRDDLLNGTEYFTVDGQPTPYIIALYHDAVTMFNEISH